MSPCFIHESSYVDQGAFVGAARACGTSATFSRGPASALTAF